MTTANHHIRVLWNDRVESVESCARRTAAWLRALATCHEGLAHWFTHAELPGDKLRFEDPELLIEFFQNFEGETERPVPEDPESLAALFEDNSEGMVLADGETMGHDLSCWCHPGMDQQLSMSITGGSNQQRNIVLIHEPPYVDPPALLYHDPAVVQAVLRAMVTTWQPEEGVVEVSESPYSDSPDDDHEPARAIWMAYLCADRLRDVPDTLPPELARDIQVIEVPDRSAAGHDDADSRRHGRLFTVDTGGAIFTLGDPEHASRARALARFLHHGALDIA